jgi:multidrug resistance protein, MATE family
MVGSIRVENSYGYIVRLALPIGVSILIPQLSMLLNTYFLGYYSPGVGDFEKQDLLAASGIAGIYYLTLVMVGYGLASGLLMLMSRRAGEDNKMGLGRLLSNGLFISMLLGVVALLFSLWFAPFLFNFSLHELGVRSSALTFIRWRVWGLPFILVCQLGNNFFIATSHARFIMIGSVVQTVVNVLFDYLLIFGHGGFPELGLKGSALASVFAEVAYCVSIWGVIYFSKKFVVYKILQGNWLDKKLCKEILIKSSPLIMQYLLSIGSWELFFIFIEHLGKSESAITQILRSVFGIVGIAAWALASTCNSMVSNLIGQQKLNDVIPVIHRIMRISLSFSLCIGVPLIIFPTYFLGLMTNDLHLVEIGKTSLRIVVIATWLLSCATIYFNGVLGTGNTKVNMLLELIAIVFYITYITIVIEHLRLPLPFAWLSEFVYWLSLFGMSAFYLHSDRWRKSIVQTPI